MEIKRFLGFTDGMQEPHKKNIEDTLRKLQIYNGKSYNTVNLLCDMLLEGRYPEKIENYQYHKRNGELSKPKTLYMFSHPDQEHYCELNKTQYDFVCYLLQNGFDTEEKMMVYDNADVERIEARKQEEREAKARQEAEERKRAEEKKRIYKMIEEQAKDILPEEKEIVDSIFLDIYGEGPHGNYSLVTLIHNFDNPYCKEELILRLTTYNQANAKIFECITGLKIPKSYNERKKYIEGLTSADFQEMTQYKSHKKKENEKQYRKREKKAVQKEAFDIVEYTPEGPKWTKVVGEPFTKYGVDMFISRSNGHVSIFLAEAGVKVCGSKSKTACMQMLKKFVVDKGKEGFLQAVKDVTQTIKNLALSQKIGI